MRIPNTPPSQSLSPARVLVSVTVVSTMIGLIVTALSIELPFHTRLTALSLALAAAHLIGYRTFKRSVPRSDFVDLENRYFRAVENLETLANLTDRGWRQALSLDKRFDDAFALISSKFKETKIKLADTHQLEASLQDKHAKFAQAVRSGLRDPLVKAISELRDLEDSSPDAAFAERLNAVYRKCAQALSAVNDSLELGHVAEVISSEPRPTSLAQLCNDLAERFSEALQLKPELSLSFFLDPKLPLTVKADPKRLMHLVGNVIDNAVESSTNGQIEVVLRPLSLDNSPGSIARLEVVCNDAGSGISPERLSAIATELDEVGNGLPHAELGIGLRAAAKIAKSLGGEIKVAPRQKQGTAVVITMELPVIAGPKVWGDLPQTFRFFSKSQPAMLSISAAGFFHGIRPIPLTSPTPEDGEDPIFVDATQLVSGKFGAPADYKPKSRYIVLLQHDQLRTRERLLRSGFRRFLTIPINSFELLRCLLNEDAPTTAKQSQHPAPNLTPLKVLVVDDVNTSRLRLTEHLTALGHEVEEASDGTGLVEHVRAGKRYDLIFTDLMMTHMDGIEAMRLAREHEKTTGHRSTIVAMSAYSYTEQPMQLDSGFDAMLKKPVYLDELDFILSKACAGRSAKQNPETKLIDLDDLRRRSAGKTKIMARVLESFIDVSRAKLGELNKIREGGELPMLVKQMHTLKGLLLEAGALSAADKARTCELMLRDGKVPDEQQFGELVEIVDAVCTEASAVVQSLDA